MPSRGHAPDGESGAVPAGSLFADVIVPRHLFRTFTYAVPEPFRERVRPGSLVRVPLGRSTVPGVIVALSAQAPTGSPSPPASTIRVRDILAVAEASEDGTIPSEILELTRQVSDYYLAPWGQCLRLILPVLSGSRNPARSRKAAWTHEPSAAAPMPADTLRLPAVAPPPWWPRLEEALARHRHETWLLEDAWDRRWGVMLEAAHVALRQKQSVLLLSPEIRRAEALAALSLRRWPDRVAQLHSHLPAALRAREWRRIQRGDADLVVGTRSAVFAPLRNLGLICVDDEEDPAFKEEQEPHYHARDVAAMRARQHGVVLLLGTAHASVETRQALAGGVRIRSAPSGQAPVRVVDLRQTPPRTLLSEPLLAGMRAALDARTGVIVFANRKGFAAALHCRDCGHSPTCTDCSVVLTLYRRTGRLACRYCGAARPIPDACPACQSLRIQPVGTGTERLEEELRRFFPAARIGRLDRDTARTPEQAAELRSALAEGRLDVLIGTQLLVQGPPMPPVGFVGVPYADAGLHRPDFRSAERTYHALRDAVALARTDGLVVLQTRLPDHHVIASIANDNPDQFYEQELAFRRALGYPPFAQLISLCVSGKSEAAVRTAAERWAAALKERGNKSPGLLTVLGPIPANVARVRGRHRWQILVKSPYGEEARHVVKATLEAMEAAKDHRLKFDADVDPIEIG